VTVLLPLIKALMLLLLLADFYSLFIDAGVLLSCLSLGSLTFTVIVTLSCI